jgi:hypothetical protein
MLAIRRNGPTRLEGIVLLLLAITGQPASANRTSTWLEKRSKLIGSVYGQGDGVLPTKSVPDDIRTYPSDPGLQGLVWNISNGLFPITSTVFFSPASGDPANRSTSAFLFHHGHSDCVCDPPPGANTSRKQMVWSACKPGCNSSMPSNAELDMPGYSCAYSIVLSYVPARAHARHAAAQQHRTPSTSLCSQAD